jgi:putative DNA primase/helicase
MANSLDEVRQQMAARGLDVPDRCDLSKAFDGYYRWRPSAETKAKKSAWARLFEYRSAKGKIYITGAYGWRGDQWEVEATTTEWTPAERAEWLEQRKAAAKAAEDARAKDAQTAADKATKLWERARPEGASSYLTRKMVLAFGVRFMRDTLLVPLRDMQGALHGLQYIGEDKKFGSGVVKEGRFHLIGEVRPDAPLAFAEGYATAATGHMATGWPVVVCFDAGNLDVVIAQWRKLYADLQFVILADDDRHLVKRLCERLGRLGVAVTPEDFAKSKGGVRPMEWELLDGGKVQLKAGVSNDANGVPRIEGSIEADGQVHLLKLENAGKAKAVAAAKRHKALVLLPTFEDRSAPHTDWNDLHCAVGIEACKEQLLAALAAGGNAAAKKRDEAPQGGGKAKGPPGDEPKRWGFLGRYTLIYGTTTVWDAQLREIIKVESLKLAHKQLTDWWLSHDDRQMVPASNVVFDPTGKSQAPEYINLFDRLPLDPKPGECDLIVEHLFNLCGKREALAHWLTCWLALPLQQPGTKMRTAVVLHGRTEGTGKSRLMDIMRMIYGRYSRSITQLQLQSEFTGWLSGMLFIVAEEVVNAADRKHHQGLLQNLITAPVVQINEKNMPVRQENNYANLSFLSNAQLPMQLNATDRRYTVINVEQEQPESYFQALSLQVENGGAEAFLSYLLNYDLQGFNAFTRPFHNKDRLTLITLSMAPDQRFFQFWSRGLADLPFCTCTARDLYKAFTAWCKTNGERFVANSTAFGRTVSDELERLGAPPKKVARFFAFSEKQVDDGDFSGDTPAQQGLVYFVAPQPPDPECDAQGACAQVVDADAFSKERISKDIRTFQEKLHLLIRSARRGL